MPFRSKIIVEPVNDLRWRLVEPLVYEGKFETFTVPAGFVTDFASVPKFLQWLVGSSGEHLGAALVHDLLWSESRAGRFHKADADGVFKRIMRESGVGVLKRYFMWSAVRVASGPNEWFRNGVGEFLLALLLFVVGLVFVSVPSLLCLVFRVFAMVAGVVVEGAARGVAHVTSG